MKIKQPRIFRDAVLSECGAYRYKLIRWWGDGSNGLTFIMLNPSTADALEDDATIRKCIGFAQRHGHDNITVVNLFAYRSTDPKGLATAEDPIGPDNLNYLKKQMKNSKIVLAWGSNKAVKEKPGASMVKWVLNELKKAGKTPYCLSKTNDGHPGHPCMLSYDRPLLEYKVGATK